ncbi:hypothetical protein HMPREF1275_00243 [Propionibacterium sp. KPL1844]|nr:hypothetical protein HMPREF1275_00243 [Propionibacterium sp. KPL1844]
MGRIPSRTPSDPSGIPFSVTMRGWVFLVSGVVITIASLGMGQPDLAWVGMLLVLLPVLGMVLVAATQLHMSCQRRIEPATIAIDERAEVTTTLVRRAGLPVGILRFEETTPRALGDAPRFAIHTLSASWRRTVQYWLEGQARGYYGVGPLLVRTCDPFRTAYADHSFRTVNHLMVTPKVHPLAPLNSLAGAGRSGSSTPRKVGAQGQDDILVREYRQGDDLRRVHWRSSARHDNLMVRREEQAWDPSIALLLDSRAARHTGSGPKASFEWMVSAGASIADHMISAGYRVRLCDADQPLLTTTGGSVVTARQNSLTALTMVQVSGSSTLDGGITSISGGDSSETIIAILARLTLDDVERLTRVRVGRPLALAIVMDTDSFTARRFRCTAEEADEHEKAVNQLEAHGWRVVRATKRSSIPQTWSTFDPQEDAR